MSSSLVIRGGTVYDGTGSPGRRADVLIDDDRIAVVGTVSEHLDAAVLDAAGHAVTPGFINVLSHAWPALQRDPSAASELFQGVTTEVFGEGFSPGPGGPALAELLAGYAPEGVTTDYPRLADGLAALARDGLAVNVASFVGATNLRLIAAGFDDRRLDAAELDRLRGLLTEELQDGALGLGTAMIYPPGTFADTAELVAISEVVGRHDGLYISHLRSEGDRFLEALEELIEIGRRAEVRAEVFHLKAAGRANWPKMARAIERIERARAAGQQVSANMYPYEAGATALAASIPPPFHVGGPQALADRLADPAARRDMVHAVTHPSEQWENLFLAAGGGEGVLFLGDLADGLHTQGRRLSEIAAELGRDEADALLEIVARDPGAGVAYFIIDEANIRLGLAQPWVCIGSDAMAHPCAPPWTDTATHPRTYGTFARILGRHCRDEGLFDLAEAVRRMTSLPADGLRLVDRGRLVPGAVADIAIFDPATIADHATYDAPHRYATGVRHVVVAGTPVVADGGLTGSLPGRVLRRGVAR